MNFTFRVFVDPIFEPESFDRELKAAMDKIISEETIIEEYRTAGERQVRIMSLQMHVRRMGIDPETLTKNKCRIKYFYSTSHDVQHAELSVDYDNWKGFYSLKDGLFMPRVVVPSDYHVDSKRVIGKIPVEKITAIDFVCRPEPWYIITPDHKDITSDIFCQYDKEGSEVCGYSYTDAGTLLVERWGVD